MPEVRKKKLGYCTQCDTKLWETDDPVESWSGSRHTFLLLDYSQTDLTICDCCAAELDSHILWQRVVEGWIAAGAEEYASKQSEENKIVQLLYVTQWKDLEF